MSSPRLGRPGLAIHFPGRRGRPRKRPADGHNAGMTGANTCVNGGSGDGTLAQGATAPLGAIRPCLTPSRASGREYHAFPLATRDAEVPTRRLFDVREAAAYLGVSPWTLRGLEAVGAVPRVRVPLPGGGELRKLLFDVRDLDRLVDAWKGVTQ